ncbi:hypothetical protein FI667_g6706, partial [Globisporangium splendens]
MSTQTEDSAIVKLIPHRWDMHAIQALANDDHVLLGRVFTDLQLPVGSVDMKVKTFGFGAPSEFHSYGFVGKSCSSSLRSGNQLEQVANGDTLLLMALRNREIRCASTLIRLGASLSTTNAMGETSMQHIFQAFTTTKLHDKHQQAEAGEKMTSPSTDSAFAQRILTKRQDWLHLFQLVHEELKLFYEQAKTQVRHELEQIYTKCAPERITKVEMQLRDFEFQEHALLTNVRRKYLASG